MKRTKKKSQRRKWKHPVIGIDLSLMATGICYRACEDLTGVSYEFNEVIPKMKERHPRWHYIRNEVRKVLLPFKNQNPLILIEGYSFGSRGRAFLSMAEIGGIIRMDIFDQGLDYTEIAPTSLKRFITGKGNVKKELILKEVFRRWGMDLESNNLADAFGLVKMGEAILGIGSSLSWTKDQLKVINKL